MNIYDVVDKQRAALLDREYVVVRDIIKAYEVAEAQVERSIRFFQAKLAHAQATGIEPSLSWYYQEARLENILREIRLQLDEFSTHALHFSRKGRDDAYELGAVHALRLAEAQVYGDVAGLHSGAFANAQALMAAASPLKALFDEIGPTATTAAREVFARAVAEGWNPRKAGNALKQEIEGLAKNRAVLIARTEMIRSYRTANREVYKRNQDVLRGWRWTAAKTPATCSLCLALDGEIFPTDQVLSSHPACRCSMVPLPKTDFGGPQPTNGEDYFQRLTPAQQDAIIGKGKGAMYREGKITLKDHVQWRDTADWGRQPVPRTKQSLIDMHRTGTLPSQRGYRNLSGYEPPAARKLSDLLDATERKANDPITKAAAAWDEIAEDKFGDRRPTFKIAKAAPPYKKALGQSPKAVEALESTIEEVNLGELVSTLKWAKGAKVHEAIRLLGDGPDLPIVFRDGATLYIHNGESLHRLQAKVMLGQTRASVRLYDVAQIAAKKSPFDEAIDEIKALGVKTVTIGEGTDETQVLASLAWAKDRIAATKVTPKEVTIFKGIGATVLPGDEMLVGTDLSDIVLGPLGEAIRQSPTVVDIPDTLWDKVVDYKAKRIRASTDRAENAEAALLATRFNLSGIKNTNKLLREWGEQRFDLLSLRAFDAGQIEDALEEAIIFYRRGEYRLGSLPEEIEKEFLKQAPSILGKVKTLDRYTDSEDFLMLQIGSQGGSNPGGMFFGRDGKRRYVKFYGDGDRALVEQAANELYRANGIEAPVSKAFLHNGKYAMSTEIIDGRTLSNLGGVNGVNKEYLEDLFDGYVTDAFLANWDVIGTDEANTMIATATGKVVRIDNGGTMIYRAQGGDKPDSILQQFGDFWTMGGPMPGGGSGQYAPVLRRLGYNSVEEAEKPLRAQAKKLAATLDRIAKTEDGWKKWLDKVSPGMTPRSKERIAKMFVARRKGIDDALQELTNRAKAAKAAEAAMLKAQKAAQAAMKKRAKSGASPWDRDPTVWENPANRAATIEAFIDDPIFTQLDPKLAHMNPDATGSGQEDKGLKQIIELMGREGLPGAATKAEVQSAPWVTFRGVSDPKFVDDFHSGELFHGLGYYGSGTYTASVRTYKHGGLRVNKATARQAAIDEAKMYARSRGGGSNAGLMAMVVDPDAKVLDYDEANNLRYEIQAAISRRLAKGPDAAETKRLQGIKKILQDVGRMAAVMGYDGVEQWMGEHAGAYLVLLNRRKIRIIKKNVWTEFARRIGRGILVAWQFARSRPTNPD